jgi:hypothetical protein
MVSKRLLYILALLLLISGSVFAQNKSPDEINKHFIFCGAGWMVVRSPILSYSIVGKDKSGHRRISN